MTSDWTRLAPAPRPMEDGKAYSVFLSYRSVNRPWVINLYDVLRENGHRPFLDQVRLRVGSDLGQEIGRGLDASMAGILVWSRAAADSEWVKHEYTVLQGKAKDDPWFYFVPVRLDDTPLPEFVDDRIFLVDLGHGRVEGKVALMQMPEQQALHSREAILLDVLREGTVALVHVAGDRLGADVLAAHPGMARREGVEGGIDELGPRLGVAGFVESLHPFFVLDTRRLHLRHEIVFDLLFLSAKDRPRVLEHGLTQAHDVEHVIFGARIELVEGVEQVEADHRTQLVRVAYDEGQVDQARLVEELAILGYQAKPMA